MTAAPQSCQPETESLPERLRVNSCRRGNETPDEAATRRVTTEFEAANHIESMEWGIASVAVALGWTELKGTSLEDHARTLQARVDELTKALKATREQLIKVRDASPEIRNHELETNQVIAQAWHTLNDTGVVVPLERSGGAT